MARYSMIRREELEDILKYYDEVFPDNESDKELAFRINSLIGDWVLGSGKEFHPLLLFRNANAKDNIDESLTSLKNNIDKYRGILFDNKKDELNEKFLVNIETKEINKKAIFDTISILGKVFLKKFKIFHSLLFKDKNIDLVESILTHLEDILEYYENSSEEKSEIILSLDKWYLEDNKPSKPEPFKTKNISINIKLILTHLKNIAVYYNVSGIIPYHVYDVERYCNLCLDLEVFPEDIFIKWLHDKGLKCDYETLEELMEKVTENKGKVDELFKTNIENKLYEKFAAYQKTTEPVEDKPKNKGKPSKKNNKKK